MAKIQQLSTQLANMIAAGEVVERPGSVIKELVENAIDAGSTEITVEIRRGGAAYMRVTDNGCGIDRGDVRTAFLRHATSKIRSEHDLLAIGTLGFRGEALAATAAVSRIDMFTKVRGTDVGTQYSIDAGRETACCETGCPDGTTIVVRDLFYNVPARMKFLKRDQTEAAYVETAVTNAALSHPEIAFIFIKDGRESLNTPGDGKLQSVVRAAFGREVANSMIRTSADIGEIKVSGLICKPTVSRASRSMQLFFINGRPVKSRLIGAALEEAYKGKIMGGRYPSCVLNIRMSLTAVDVNVHPAKLEVKFAREREIFSAVYNAVSSALEAEWDVVEGFVDNQKVRRPMASQDNLTREQQVMTAGETRAEAPRAYTQSYAPRPAMPVMGETFGHTQGQVAQSSRPAYHTPAQEGNPKVYAGLVESLRDAAENLPKAAEGESPDGVSHVNPQQTMINPYLTSNQTLQNKMPDFPAVSENPAQGSPENAPEAPAEPPEIPENSTPVETGDAADALPSGRVIGECFDSFIIVELEDELWLLDKHACHEKVLYNQLRKTVGQPQGQVLLTPVQVRLSPEEKAACLQHQDLLARAGFEVDDFGAAGLALRQIPTYLAESDAPFVISDIARRLMENRNSDLNEIYDGLLKSISCKAAIKAGSALSREEMERVALMALTLPDVRNCPHGRPVAVKITRYQMEKWFKRIL